MIRNIKLNDILEAAIEEYGVDASEVFASGRAEPLVQKARDAFTYAARTLTDASYPEINAVVRPSLGGRSHSTTVTTMNRARERYNEGGMFKVEVDRVMDRVAPHRGVMSPIAIARDLWFATNDGRKAMKVPLGPNDGKYLRNRLELAFLAGVDAGVAECERAVEEGACANDEGRVFKKLRAAWKKNPEALWQAMGAINVPPNGEVAIKAATMLTDLSILEAAADQAIATIQPTNEKQGAMKEGATL